MMGTYVMYGNEMFHVLLEILVEITVSRVFSH